jgi:hypothetical protein
MYKCMEIISLDLILNVFEIELETSVVPHNDKETYVDFHRLHRHTKSHKIALSWKKTPLEQYMPRTMLSTCSCWFLRAIVSPLSMDEATILLKQWYYEI